MARRKKKGTGCLNYNFSAEELNRMGKVILVSQYMNK